MVKHLGKVKDFNVDLVIRLGSFWWGVHYSERYKAACIAIIPCVVIRIGKTEYGTSTCG